MNTRSCTKSLLQQFEIQNLNSAEKPRNSDSPTSSILKTPTAIFVSSRSSSTKRLKFANGPADLENLKNSAHEYIAEINSNLETTESFDSNLDGDVDGDGKIISIDQKIEVAVSPSKTMQVSPESWNAFLEYKKYHDYPNETEKTDYTYSRLSKFRHKEIIPGFMIRPNLSRSSISSFRRSSIFSPGNQSSINESLLSYDFKIHSSSNPEISYDFKTSTINNNKSSRSKYYLRSSTFEDTDIGEIDSKPLYFEKKYFSDSAPEWSMKKSSSKSSIHHVAEPEMTSTSVKSRYMNKVRSLDLDDADIDEIDDSRVECDKYYRANSKTWHQYKPDSMRTASGYFSSFFTAMFFYLAAAGTQTKNLFSKHILRRDDSLMSDHNLAYSTASGSNISWTNEKPYTSDYYYSGRHYRSGEGSWYQAISSYIQDRYSKISNLMLGKEATRYSSYGYEQSSKKRKFWWFLLPILLLTGFWLYKEDQKHGIISGQYKALDCRTNGFFTTTESSIKSVWRWIYYNYKRMASSASCYVNDSWERLKLPFAHFYDKFSSVGFLQGVWNASREGLWNIFYFLRDVFWYLVYFLFEFFTDLLSAIGNTFHYALEFFKNVCFATFDGFHWFVGGSLQFFKGILLNLGSLLHMTTLPSREILENDVPVESRREICYMQKDADKYSMRTEDFNSISWDLSDMKKKILKLETEVGKGRESIKSRNEFYDKQLEENYLALQKYQDMVNDALISSKKQEKASISDMKYVLDSHSNDLKQWILHNFMLKADSPPSNLDESKIAFLIAKYGNKSGEESLSAKEKFQQVLIGYKKELDSLRKEFTSLTRNSVHGEDISVAYVKKLVEDAIKLYDADKTGRVDYALETAGGQVQSIRCTETYIASPKSYILLGWAVYTKTSSPRDAITPGMAAGQCWAFVGSQGFLVLQLSHTIKVTGFTIEHISKLLVPKGHIESAPKNFSVWGLKSEYDVEPYLFGEYTYLDNDETLQYFQVIYETSEKYNMVELKITSNHGNPNYTCLYRFRVHGDLNPIQL